MTSVIIVTWNQHNLLKQCIESIFRHTRVFELIIIDNGSTDGTKEYLNELGVKKVLPCGEIINIRTIFNKENLGFVKANNQGILLSTGKYVCFLNNDTIVSHNWLLKLTRCMESNPQISLVGPYTNYCAGRQQYPAPYKNTEEFEEFSMRFSQKEQDVDFLVGFCLLVKQEVFAKCGMFDEDFGIGNWEDNLLCWKARQFGYRLKIANCYIHHIGSQSFCKDPKAYNELLARNQKIFYQKTGRAISISCIMICSDNEQPKHLQACLESIFPWVDEVCISFNYSGWLPKQKLSWDYERLIFPRAFKEIIKDFGYRDGGKALETEYVQWHNDFAEARNRSLKMATSQWIIWLDSDDVFINPITLREAVVANDQIGDVIFCNVFAPSEDGVETHLRHARIFRNNLKYKWKKPIHEDIVLSFKEHKARIIHGDLVIRHIGYLEKGSTLQKNERNLKIMRQYFKTNQYPDSLDYFHLANAYILLGTKESKEEAIKTIDKCLALPLPETDDLWPKMIFLKARIHHDLGRLDEAKTWYQLSIEKRNYIESYLGIAEVLITQKNIDVALDYLEKMLEIGDKDGFEITSVPKNLKEMETEMYYNLGYCYFIKENFNKAKEFFGRCLQVASYHLKAIDYACDILRKEGKHNEAFNITLQAIQKHPGYAAGWNNLAGYEILQKRYITAHLFVNQALTLHPGYQDALSNLKLIEEKNPSLKRFGRHNAR